MPRSQDLTPNVVPEQEKSLTDDMDTHEDATTMPSMDDAFATLCHAMIGKVAAEENLALEERIHMIMGFYENKLHVVAWRHAVQILEQVLGEALVER